MNAKKEFLEFVEENNLQLKCGTFEKLKYWWEDRRQKKECKIINLPVNYTQEELGDFLSELDFEDSMKSDENSKDPTFQLGYNVVWFADGSWARHRYVEGIWRCVWVHYAVPPIPETLKR
jgi:hypothetical protein